MRLSAACSAPTPGATRSSVALSAAASTEAWQGSGSPAAGSCADGRCHTPATWWSAPARQGLRERSEAFSRSGRTDRSLSAAGGERLGARDGREADVTMGAGGREETGAGAKRASETEEGHGGKGW